MKKRVNALVCRYAYGKKLFPLARGTHVQHSSWGGHGGRHTPSSCVKALSEGGAALRRGPGWAGGLGEGWAPPPGYSPPQAKLSAC